MHPLGSDLQKFPRDLIRVFLFNSFIFSHTMPLGQSNAMDTSKQSHFNLSTTPKSYSYYYVILYLRGICTDHLTSWWQTNTQIHIP